MGLVDKMKKILFDEDEVEIPVNSDELPERTKKSSKSKEVTSQRGFIDYHRDEEEDTIKEVVVPKEEIVEEEEVESAEDGAKTFNFPIDIDFEEELPSRLQNFDDELEETEEIPTYKPRMDYSNFTEEVKKKPVEEKDYRQLINTTTEQREKKPFKVTPVISPVYGILDKNYKPSEVVNKAEVVNKRDPNKPRLFGPVSYNDEPLPEPHKYEPKEEPSLKEELVELNTTISELINDTVNPSEALESMDMVDENTKNYEEIETSGIENEYIGNNNIEDAFEPTSEFDTVDSVDDDVAVEDITPSVNLDELITEDNEEELSDTIETDLFNLIDSMYKSDESEENEEE